jgi:hypothetical protein
MTRLLGVNVGLTKTGTTTDDQGREFALGTQAALQDGSVYEYVQAAEAITQYQVVGITEAGQASKLTKALADAGRRIGVAQVAFADNDFGWVCKRSGADTVKVRVAANCLPNERLYTTGTAGSLDDTSASQTAVFGIVLRGSAGASAASALGLTIRAIVEYPHTEATA